MFDSQITPHGSALLPLKVSGLTYDAGGKRLIDGLDLKLEANLVTVILGPNGAGKSLLLRLLHGMLTPTGGDISWGGAGLTQDVRQCQAMVFQRPVLLRRSVAANIDFVLKACRNIPRHDRGNIARRDELLSTVGLTEQRNQPARQLSGGEQQRLALARALALKPDVLFLDEATVNLDPRSVALIEEIIRDAHGKGTKIIAVTHDIGQAKRLADDIVFVYRGRVAEHRLAQEFFTSPISRPARDHLAGRIVI